MIVARNMRIDFTGAPLLFSPNKAFATIVNASSVASSAFEGFLAKVMARARDQLEASHPALSREIDLFIAQEGHHYRVHKIYNKRLYAAYPGARRFETELGDALRERMETRSLADNLAFSTGFENFACVTAKYYFTRGLHHFDGPDQRIPTLWLWHAAEEYEHRTSCNRAMDAVGPGYRRRISGLIDFMRLMVPWHARVVDYMLSVDRATMTEPERAESIAEKKFCDREMLGYVLPRISRIFLPFYDPGRVGAPKALFEALDRFERLALSPEPLAAG